MFEQERREMMTIPTATAKKIRSSQFAMSFPALNGEVVMQGHADYCAEHGHATHTSTDLEGNTTTGDRCPRCGKLTTEPSAEQIAEAVIRSALIDCRETGSKMDGRMVVEFRSAETAAERAAMIAPHVASVEICPNPTWIAFRRHPKAV